MSTVICDLGAWITYASRAPLTPIPKEEADRVLREATCTARQAAAVREAPWFSSMDGLARALTGLPESKSPQVDLVIAPGSREHRVVDAIAHWAPFADSPHESLWRIEERWGIPEPAYVVSPGLYLLMRACSIDDALLVAVGCSLCASYRLRPDTKMRIENRPPLTTFKGLDSFVRQIPRNATGSSKIKRILGYICERSHSPMETALALLVGLPRRWGGFGLPKPELNPPIDLGPDAQRLIGGQRRVYIDLLWRDAGVGVEYDSRQHHSATDQQLHDKQRQLACDHAGIELAPWTGETVYDETAFSLAVERLAEKLGVPFSWDTRYLVRRRALRSQLLNPHLFW